MQLRLCAVFEPFYFAGHDKTRWYMSLALDSYPTGTRYRYRVERTTQRRYNCIMSLEFQNRIYYISPKFMYKYAHEGQCSGNSISHESQVPFTRLVQVY
jgi:hypothetical protein